MDTNPQSQKQERMDRFFERFGHDHPYALFLLQGHLLIEELLEEIVLSVCRNKDVALEARMSFFTKLKLAQAIDGFNSKFWPCLDKLNIARNELAHGRDISHLEKKIDSFIDSVRSACPTIDWREDRPEDLAVALVAIHGAISRIAAEHVHA